MRVCLEISTKPGSKARNWGTGSGEPRWGAISLRVGPRNISKPLISKIIQRFPPHLCRPKPLQIFAPFSTTKFKSWINPTFDQLSPTPRIQVIKPSPDSRNSRLTAPTPVNLYLPSSCSAKINESLFYISPDKLNANSISDSFDVESWFSLF